VIDAMHAAMHYSVDMEALIPAAGARIAGLLQVEAAMVTSGAAAALALAAMACVAGTDPEKMQSLPDTAGFERNECVVPASSRTHYDQAVRLAGLQMVEVNSAPELAAAMASPRVAMALVLADRFGVESSRSDRRDGTDAEREGQEQLGLTEMAAAAAETGVPLLVDAAADILVVPNPYIAAGATLVAYSGGKVVKGPQGGGLLLGNDAGLIRAAIANGSPHHAAGRPLKVPKEVIVGMVTAVEQWVEERDIEAEYEEWRGWYREIAAVVERVAGVSTSEGAPSAGGPFPTLQIEWDGGAVPITAQEVHDQLLAGSPPIQTHATGAGHDFPIRPAALKPGQHRVVAERLREVLAAAAASHPAPADDPAPAEASADVSGSWEVRLRFSEGEATHRLELRADGGQVTGRHHGTLTEGELHGTVAGDTVELSSTLFVPSTSIGLDYTFLGRLERRGEGRLQMGGELVLSQDDCEGATWAATRVASRL